MNHGVGGCVQDLPALSNPLDEYPLVGDQGFGFLHRLSNHRSPFTNAKRAQLELMPGCSGTACLLLSAILVFIFLARRFEVDAEQRPAEQSQHDRGADRAEDIGRSCTDRCARLAKPAAALAWTSPSLATPKDNRPAVSAP